MTLGLLTELGGQGLIDDDLEEVPPSCFDATADLAVPIPDRGVPHHQPVLAAREIRKAAAEEQLVPEADVLKAHLSEMDFSLQLQEGGESGCRKETRWIPVF